MAITLQAYLAQLQGTWGVISELARTYQVSRPFIYQLLSDFKGRCARLFFPPDAVASVSQEAVEARILSYRLEGRCSIDAISTLLKRAGLPYSSQGSVSEALTRLGRQLPNTLENEDNPLPLVVFATDEIFAKAQPILITVDPVSTAILRIDLADNRTAEQWCEHYEGLLANGIRPKQLTSDAGTGMTAANATLFPDIPWQLDTFHAIAHRLGDWDRRLEKRVRRAASYAADREATLASAKSDAVIDQRLTLCFEADQLLKEAQQRHEDFRYLYREIIQQLNPFDAAGQVRKQQVVESTLSAALDLMEERSCQGLKKIIPSVRKALPHCLGYFADAQKVVQRCEQLTDNPDVLTALCLAWQWDKVRLKSKQTARKHHAIEQRDFYLEWARLLMADKKKVAHLKDNVWQQLDHIIQASSIVEFINSLLRPYLNHSRNQVTQEFLNLFMFYHNHRRYRAGKRKGKTPMELLTGTVQTENWVALLQSTARKYESTLAA